MENKELILLSQKGDRSALEDLLLKNELLIWSIVHRFRGRGAELEDLFQIGSLGFIKAVKGFDVSYNTEFSTYAVPKIMGEIKRFFRDDGMIKVSRDIKSKAAVISAAIAKLEQEHDNVRISDIARETGFTEEEISYIRAATDYAYSLDAPLTDDGITLGDSIHCDESEKLIDNISVKTALDKLPEREKKVVILRFYRDMTQQKTADILGLSQVQVSRLEKRAIAFMKEQYIE